MKEFKTKHELGEAMRMTLTDGKIQELAPLLWDAIECLSNEEGEMSMSVEAAKGFVDQITEILTTQGDNKVNK